MNIGCVWVMKRLEGRMEKWWALKWIRQMWEERNHKPFTTIEAESWLRENVHYAKRMRCCASTLSGKFSRSRFIQPVGHTKVKGITGNTSMYRTYEWRDCNE